MKKIEFRHTRRHPISKPGFSNNPKEHLGRNFDRSHNGLLVHQKIFLLYSKEARELWQEQTIQ
jgi:hypothetical protein